MGFTLDTAETLEDGLRRIALELVDEAHTALIAAQDAPPGEFDTLVHSVRKTCKKMRGLLRLSRPSLGNKTYRHENTFYRDLSRRLAGTRESHVMLTLLEATLADPENDLDADRYTALVAHLRENYEKRALHMREDGALLQESAALLVQARGRIEGKWQLDRKPRKLIAEGLLRVYSRGHTERAVAHKKPTTDNLHEWRKPVKYLWYHLQILAPIWPEGVGAYITALDDLGDALGADHDAAELKALLYQFPDLFAETDDMMALVYVLEDQRAQLQESAWHLGARVYAEAPGAFVDRHIAYWQAWR
jgi:CHAD domain-containing protein